MIDIIEQNFRSAAELIALATETLAILIVAIGAIQAAIECGRTILAPGVALAPRRIWLRFAAWILLALEFALGADVIRTAIAPSWDDIGKLGAIAVIRTALSYFLGKDLEEAEQLKPLPSSEPIREAK